MNTVIGFIFGIIVLIMGIKSNGDLSSFWDVGSVYITLGGTVAALLVHFPLRSLKNALVASIKVFFTKKQDLLKLIDVIVELADQARKGGLLSLEDKVEEYKNGFLKKGIFAVTASHDSASVRKALETELAYIQQRHETTQEVLMKAASYAPAFGMIGTLIGLINMLKNLDQDQSVLGPSMSIALVTTFYGAVLANAVFLPIAGKLKRLSEEELMAKQLIIEGLIAIQEGRNPRVIKDELMSMLSDKEKAKIERMEKKKKQQEKNMAATYVKDER